MNSLALLADEVGVNERTLRRAVAQGTLRAARPSPRTLRLALSERQYARRNWPLLSQLRQALRTEHNVRLAVLFGSAARGTDTAGSDVDVLVGLRDADLRRVVDLSAKLTALAGRAVDVVRLEDARVEPSFLDEVATDGRVLIDRDAQWPALRRAEGELRDEDRRGQSARTRAALAGIDRLLEGRG